MQVHVKNLGPLEVADFTLGDLTLICGENNTGKTYVTYLVFGFLSLWWESLPLSVEESEMESLLRDGVVQIDLSEYAQRSDLILSTSCKEFINKIDQVFAAPAGRFKETEFEMSIDPKQIESFLTDESYEKVIRFSEEEVHFSITKTKGSQTLSIALLADKERMRNLRTIIERVIGDVIKSILFKRVLPNPFIASAERTGAAIFWKELDFARNQLLRELGRTDGKMSPIQILLKTKDIEYAMPVEKNVDFARNLESVSKKKSFIQEDHPELLESFADIIGGSYTVTRNGELCYIPRGSKIRLSMGEGSSAVRSLLDIGFYLKHVAQPNDLLIIDEPELNLHPKNQRRVARLLAQLVNLGVRVFITTHSDYIVKEFNTLLMLNHEKPHLKKIAEQHHYQKNELLSPDQVKVYLAQKAPVSIEGGIRKRQRQTLTLANIDPEWGIAAQTFDDTIEEMNQIQESILWGETIRE